MLFGNTAPGNSPLPAFGLPQGPFGKARVSPQYAGARPRGLFRTGPAMLTSGPPADELALPAPDAGNGGAMTTEVAKAPPIMSSSAPTAPRPSGLLGSGGALGGSMRQPFDYQGTLAQLNPPQKQHSKTHNTLMRIAEVAGPVLMALGGNEAGANAAMQNIIRKREGESQRDYETRKLLAEWQHDDWARQNGADLKAADPFTIGRNRMMYDPATGQAHTIYHTPADFEDYAAAQGLEPGSEDYFKAVEDYVLRANGPSAYDRDVGLDDHRTANDLRLEGARQGNRVGLENLRHGHQVGLRGTPTYRDSHPLPRAAGRSSVPDNLPTVRSPAEAAKLPRGTKFRTPDGAVKIVP